MAEAIRLTKGVHASRVRSSLTPGRTNRIFAILNGPSLQVLQRYPLEVLELGNDLPPGWAAGYFPGESRITVLPFVPADQYGELFTPGVVDTVTSAARSETEAIQRNLMHEIGHLLLDRGPREVKQYVKATFRRCRTSAISMYARVNSSEFFAESWVAYNFEKEAFLGFSEEVYSMVEHALEMTDIL